MRTANEKQINVAAYVRYLSVSTMGGMEYFHPSPQLSVS